MGTKANIYITKDEAIQAIRNGRTREEMEWGIKSIKATKVKRSKKVARTYYKGKFDEEYCPHCRKKIEVYQLYKEVPKQCYCFWCGGAVIREKGLSNPMFDYSMLTPEQAEIWGSERYGKEDN